MQLPKENGATRVTSAPHLILQQPRTTQRQCRQPEPPHAALCCFPSPASRAEVWPLPFAERSSRGRCRSGPGPSWSTILLQPLGEGTGQQGGSRPPSPVALGQTNTSALQLPFPPSLAPEQAQVDPPHLYPSQGIPQPPTRGPGPWLRPRYAPTCPFPPAATGIFCLTEK